MNCLECQDWLQRRLDGDAAGPTEALEQHWSTCTACRERHAAATRLLEAMKRVQAPKAPSGLAQAIVGKVLQDRRQRLRKMRRRVIVTMALAASVMFILLTAYFWTRQVDDPTPMPAPAIAKKQDSPPQPEVKPAPKQDPSNPIASLTERWIDTTREHATVVLAATNLEGVEKLPAVNELPFDPNVREAGQEVTDGVRVVTQSTRQAFNYFTRELPMPTLVAKGN